MSTNRVRTDGQTPEACEASASPFGHLRQAICGTLALGFLAVQPADVTPKEPANNNLDYLFDGIEIIKEPAKGQTPKENESPDDSDTMDDPSCTPETCMPA
jgi:hypothetical protein